MKYSFHNLSLKAKFIIAFAAAGILISLAGLSIVYFLAVAGINKIEDGYLERENISAQILIDNRAKEMLKYVRDYAWWD